MIKGGVLDGKALSAAEITKLIGIVGQVHVSQAVQRYTVALAAVDLDFAKQQLDLMLQEMIRKTVAAMMRSLMRHSGSRTLHFSNCSQPSSCVEQAVTVSGPSIA